MTNHRFRNGRSMGGVTLIELMVAVVILGIIASIAIPNYTGAATVPMRAA